MKMKDVLSTNIAVGWWGGGGGGDDGVCWCTNAHYLCIRGFAFCQKAAVFFNVNSPVFFLVSRSPENTREN